MIKVNRNINLLNVIQTRSHFCLFTNSLVLNVDPHNFKGWICDLLFVHHYNLYSHMVIWIFKSTHTPFNWSNTSFISILRKGYQFLSSVCSTDDSTYTQIHRFFFNKKNRFSTKRYTKSNELLLQQLFKLPVQLWFFFFKA